MAARAARRALIVALAVLLGASIARAGSEETIRIPAADGASLVTTVKHPPGGAKRPLVVINHGSPADGQRANLARPSYASLSAWFLARG